MFLIWGIENTADYLAPPFVVTFMALDFSGPLLKVERADKHIKELQILLRRYAADNAKRFSIQNQKRALKQGRIIQDAQPAKHTPTVLGDALHNLRASLDHAYCILIEANGHSTTDRSSFPFTKDWASMKGSIKGHMKSGNGPSPAVVDYIETEIQPHPGGKHNLFDLHRLDIADKHQCILPMSADLHIKHAEVVDPTTGETCAELKDVAFMGFANSSIGIQRGLFVTEHDLKSAFDVRFGKGQPLEGERLLPTVKALREAVQDSLNGLRLVC